MSSAKTFAESFWRPAARSAHDPAGAPPAAFADLDRAHAASRGCLDHAGRRADVRAAGQAAARGHPNHLLGSAVSPAVRRVFAAATAGQGGAADPDRDRPVAGVSRRNLEHRRRGAVHHGRDLRCRHRAGLLPDDLGADLSGYGTGGRARRLGMGDDPGGAQGAVRHERDPGFADAGLRRRGAAGVGLAEAAAQPRGHGLSGLAQLRSNIRRPQTPS